MPRCHGGQGAAGLILLSALLVMTSAAAYAEETGEQKATQKTETLLGLSDDELTFSGYGGPYISFAKVGDATGVYVGGRGCAIINDSFVFGLGGMGLTTPGKLEDITGETYDGSSPSVNAGYGGVIIGYHILSRNLFHISMGTLIGAGGVSSKEKTDGVNGDTISVSDSFFILEPEVYFYVNVTRFFRLGVGSTYRYVNGIDSGELSNKDFSGPSASIIAAFGWF